MNFTDYCYDMPANIHIGVTSCAHSLCVTVVEPRILAGQYDFVWNKLSAVEFFDEQEHGAW